jgi:hypothetical protein
MNLYGFAGGDPVNFSDPFGLTACSTNNREGFWCKLNWAVHDFIVGREGDPKDPSGQLASPGALDPVAFAAGAMAGGLVGGAEAGAAEEMAPKAKYGSTPEGRPFTKHYGTETGPVRNIPGSVVDHTVNTVPGVPVKGGKFVHYDPENNVTVVTGDGGSIVSVHKGKP